MRLLCALWLIVVFAAIAACVPNQIVKTVQVDVPKYIRTPLPAALIQDRIVVEPDPSCWFGTERVFCNGQMATMLADYREQLAQSNADKAALRAINLGVADKPEKPKP